MVEKNVGVVVVVHAAAEMFQSVAYHEIVNMKQQVVG